MNAITTAYLALAETPGERLRLNRERQERLGIRSGQRFLFHFERDCRDDWFEALDPFETWTPESMREARRKASEHPMTRDQFLTQTHALAKARRLSESA